MKRACNSFRAETYRSIVSFLKREECNHLEQKLIKAQPAYSKENNNKEP